MILATCGAELTDREAWSRDRDDPARQGFNAINRDLTAELATQTQARLNATERGTEFVFPFLFPIPWGPSLDMKLHFTLGYHPEGDGQTNE